MTTPKPSRQRPVPTTQPTDRELLSKALRSIARHGCGKKDAPALYHFAVIVRRHLRGL